MKTIVQSNAREKHTVRKGDERIQLTTVELLFRLLLAEAMKGNIQAEKLIDHYLERQRLPTDNLAYFIVPESLSPDEFERQIKIRNSLRLREALADVLLENRLLKKSILLDPEAAGNCRSARAD